MGELLVAVDAEADEDGIPGKIGEARELMQLKLARGVPEFQVDDLVVHYDGLLIHLVLRGGPGLVEHVTTETAGRRVSLAGAIWYQKKKWEGNVNEMER